MDKFKVGDKVKLVRTDGEWSWYEEYLGQMFTIKEIEEDWKGTFAVLEEKGTLMPYLKNLELVKDEYTYEDLKKSPIGTKVTFENEGILVKTTEKRLESRLNVTNIENLKNLKDDYYGKIIKIEEPTYKTVYEHKEEILDEAEKRYLRGVIRPFRDKVEYICKYHHTSVTNEEFICICFLNSNGLMLLPYFKEHSMYKGMELDKNYTLEELGL